MTPLCQRMIEDMHIRNFATTTQRSYVHYVDPNQRLPHTCRHPARDIRLPARLAPGSAVGHRPLSGEGRERPQPRGRPRLHRAPRRSGGACQHTNRAYCQMPAELPLAAGGGRTPWSAGDPGHPLGPRPGVVEAFVGHGPSCSGGDLDTGILTISTILSFTSALHGIIVTGK